ncbi:hypothetical protein NQ318_014534 [Aromia moschata]|uniref:Transposase n=1 Tax=Aromia moschata TaxID=1265417 RepID=A0AAV8X6B5_9CUCU|nr:hypothetical protein NQ318_014534 [Aromia moschata]
MKKNKKKKKKIARDDREIRKFVSRAEAPVKTGEGGGERLSDRQIFRWHKAFAEGREDVNDRNCAGRPSTSSFDDNVKRVRDWLNTDRRLSVRLISETLDITKTIVHEIVSESLGMRKIYV